MPKCARRGVETLDVPHHRRRDRRACCQPLRALLGVVAAASGLQRALARPIRWFSRPRKRSSEKATAALSSPTSRSARWRGARALALDRRAARAAARTRRERCAMRRDELAISARTRRAGAVRPREAEHVVAAARRAELLVPERERERRRRRPRRQGRGESRRRASRTRADRELRPSDAARPDLERVPRALAPRAQRRERVGVRVGPERNVRELGREPVLERPRARVVPGAWRAARGAARAA